MMKKRFSTGISIFAAVVVAGLGFGAVSVSADSAGDIVKKRQETMKQLGGHTKAIKAFVQDGKGSASDVGRRADEIMAIARKIPALFPKGSSLDDISDPKTGAKPEIWADWNGFAKASDTLGGKAGALKSVALGSGDRQAIAQAFGDMGKNGCGGCHKTFRLKLEK